MTQALNTALQYPARLVNPLYLLLASLSFEVMLKPGYQEYTSMD
jgi:hypothetical protein